MIKIKFWLSLHKCHISLHIFCHNLFPLSSFLFHAKPRSYGNPHCPHHDISLISQLNLFSVTSNHSYFLIILESVSYLIWIIAVVKNQKLFLMKNYQLVISIKQKCIVFDETSSFWYEIYLIYLYIDKCCGIMWQI